MVIHVWDYSRRAHARVCSVYVEEFQAAWRSQQQGAAIVPLPEGAVSELERLLDEFICELVSQEWKLNGYPTPKGSTEKPEEPAAGRGFVHEAGGSASFFGNASMSETSRVALQPPSELIVYYDARFQEKIASNQNVQEVLRILSEDFLKNIQRLYRRFNENKQLICQYIAGSPVDHQQLAIQQIHFAQGDAHNAGQTTLILDVVGTSDQMIKVVYKPRDLRIDAVLFGRTLEEDPGAEHMPSLVEIINRHSRLELSSYTILPHQDAEGYFGFTEYLPSFEVAGLSEFIKKCETFIVEDWYQGGKVIDFATREALFLELFRMAEEHFRCPPAAVAGGSMSRRKNLLLAHFLQFSPVPSAGVVKTQATYKKKSMQIGGMVGLAMLCHMCDLHQQNMRGSIIIDAEVSAQVIPDMKEYLRFSELVSETGGLKSFYQFMDIKVFGAKGLQVIALSGEDSALLNIPEGNALFYINDDDQGVCCGPDQASLKQGILVIQEICADHVGDFQRWCGALPGDLQVRVLPYPTSVLKGWLEQMTCDCLQVDDLPASALRRLPLPEVIEDAPLERMALNYRQEMAAELLHRSLPRFYVFCDETALCMDGVGQNLACANYLPRSPRQILHASFEAAPNNVVLWREVAGKMPGAGSLPLPNRRVTEEPPIAAESGVSGSGGEVGWPLGEPRRGGGINLEDETRTPPNRGGGCCC